MDFSLSFLAGLLGSLHCVGMCGAIVLAYSTQHSDLTGLRKQAVAGAVTVASVPAHAVYNAGRVLSYTLVGALAGFLGSMITSIREAGVWVAIVCGVAMVIAGLLMLDLVPRLNVWSPGEHTWLRRLHLTSVADLLALRSLESKFYVGFLTPFLPCGLLYSMFLKAASSASAFDGAVTMLLFALGSVPALLITGVISTYAGIKLRFYANRLAAMTIIVMGALMIMRGADVPLPFMSGSHHEQMQHDHQVPGPR